MTYSCSAIALWLVCATEQVIMLACVEEMTSIIASDQLCSTSFRMFIGSARPRFDLASFCAAWLFFFVGHVLTAMPIQWLSWIWLPLLDIWCCIVVVTTLMTKELHLFFERIQQQTVSLVVIKCGCESSVANNTHSFAQQWLPMTATFLVL